MADPSRGDAGSEGTGDGADPAEIWGRRIGRALSILALAMLAAYVWMIYAR